MNWLREIELHPSKCFNLIWLCNLLMTNLFSMVCLKAYIVYSESVVDVDVIFHQGQAKFTRDVPAEENPEMKDNGLGELMRKCDKSSFLMSVFISYCAHSLIFFSNTHLIIASLSLSDKDTFSTHFDRTKSIVR